MLVSEAQLNSALSDMEAIVKGGNGSGLGNKTPKTTAEANGGLSSEGDKSEMAVSGDLGGTPAAGVSKAAKGGKKKTLAQWAKEEEEEHSSSESVGKAVDDDESTSEDEDESSESESESASSKSMRKCKDKARKSSLADLIKSDSNAGPVVEVSSFIEGLVDQVSEADMRLRKSVRALHEEQRAFQRAESKAIQALAKSVIALKEQIDSMGDAPAGSRRSVLTKSEVNERFPESNGIGGFDFSRDQVLDAMTELAKSQKIEPLDVTRYETTGSMDLAVQRKVEDFLTKSAR